MADAFDKNHSKYEESVESGTCLIPQIQTNLLKDRLPKRKGTKADAFDKDHSKCEECSGNKIKKSRIQFAFVRFVFS